MHNSLIDVILWPSFNVPLRPEHSEKVYSLIMVTLFPNILASRRARILIKGICPQTCHIVRYNDVPRQSRCIGKSIIAYLLHRFGDIQRHYCRTIEGLARDFLQRCRQYHGRYFGFGQATCRQDFDLNISEVKSIKHRYYPNELEVEAVEGSHYLQILPLVSFILAHDCLQASRGLHIDDP